jgi:DNA polymerase III sliding clamp (beta) subunit (PCNA family)
MNVRFDENNIYFTGANGIMLSEYKIKNISNLKEGSFLLNYDFVMGLRRALGDETQIFFEIDNGKIKVKFDNICFYGKIVIGHVFPEYVHKFDDYSDSIIINKDIIVSSLLPFSDVLDDGDNKRLTVSINNKKLTLYNDHASFVYEDDVAYDGAFVIDINGSFMMQTVDAIVDDKLLVKFSTDKGCIIFDSGNFEDQKALITPIKRKV